MKKYIFYSMILFLAVSQYKTKTAEKKEKTDEKPDEKPIDWKFVSSKVGPHLKGIPGLPAMVVEYAKFTPEEIKKATEQLFEAIGKLDLEEIRNAIRNGANVSDQNEWKETPLGLAILNQEDQNITADAKKNKAELVKLLLQSGANPDTEFLNPNTGRLIRPVASAYDNQEVFKLLIEYGADVNFRLDPAEPDSLTLLEIINKKPRLKKVYEQVQKKKAETKQESSASKARAFWQNLEKGKP